jgi:6-phosphogluconolactonase
MTPVLRCVSDAEAVARAAAEEIVAAAARAIDERGRFTVALAGGSTPRRTYELLAAPDAPYRARLRWDATHVFFGDERHVPPDHPDSNYRMARAALLDRVAVASVHRMRGEEPRAAAAAEAYEAELRRFFGLDAADAPPPRLDLVVLGLGPDGHTASLFPGSAALDERRRWAVAPYVERLGSHRITLTLPVLDRAREVLFLAVGAEKADALARAVTPAPGAAPAPAGLVRPEHGALVWIMDRAAASRVSSDPT